MEKTSLLLTNYPRISQTAMFEQVGGTDTIEIETGYDISGKIDNMAVTNQIANDLILGLLSYEEILVEASHVWDVMQVWGSEYLKELLRLRIVRVVNDASLLPVMLKRNGEHWHVDFFNYSNGGYYPKTNTNIEFNHGEWNHIANTFHKCNFRGLEAETILTLIDEGARKIDEKKVREIASQETTKDLRSQIYWDQFKVDEKGLWGRLSFERQIRLMELNKTCVIASFLNADSIKCDGQINGLLSQKTDSILSRKFPDGTSSLNKILFEKKFPELGSMFVKGLISLDDLLKLRDNFNGRLFRYWINQNRYDEQEMRADIMNTTHSVLGSNISQFLRMMSCNMLGLLGFLPGLAASAVDSYIINKISTGWHPNFFLDDRVKKLIDASLAQHEKEEKRERVKQSLQGVGRNDKCPCGSGLKFKKCHGKFL
ncbi:MAG: SEC-C domain-containing protein [Muribaculaceae bacterium]|nr:SEC-C domain-containing protein [Muribaculaceae bacterium]MDE6649480.1 SEC-C domain-containing protein [Muribaculaceae bacterium]